MERYLRPTFRELNAYVSLGQSMGGKWRSYANIPGALDHGVWESSFRGQGMTFDSVREYVAGDEVRHIDWSVTARTGKPHLKLFREERQRQVLLVLDDGPTMQFGTKRTFKIVQAARLAAMLGGLALADRERLGAVRFSIAGKHSGMQWYAPTSSRRSLFAMLKDLSLPPEVTNGQHFTDLGQVLERLVRAKPLQSVRSIVYILSDFSRLEAAEPKVEQALRQLCHHHQLVFVSIDDVADYRMANVGDMQFISPGGKTQRVATHSLRLQEVYQNWWQKRRQTMEAKVRQLGIAHVGFHTHDSPKQLRLSLARSMGRG